MKRESPLVGESGSVSPWPALSPPCPSLNRRWPLPARAGLAARLELHARINDLLDHLGQPQHCRPRIGAERESLDLVAGQPVNVRLGNAGRFKGSVSALVDRHGAMNPAGKVPCSMWAK